MNKKSIDILEKIIKAGGSCDERKVSDCRECLLGRVKVHQNGSPMGCIEMLGIEGLETKEANSKYLEAATMMLADILLHEILED